MCEQMMFPKTWEEYEELYGFTDKEQVYSNGSRLIHSFRVEQWLDHLERMRSSVSGEWIPHPLEKGGMSIDRDVCSVCGVRFVDAWMFNYCPNCGAEMKND